MKEEEGKMLCLLQGVIIEDSIYEISNFLMNLSNKITGKMRGETASAVWFKVIALFIFGFKLLRQENVFSGNTCKLISFICQWIPLHYSHPQKSLTGEQ